MRRPIAASPTSCSSGCRWRISATAFRNCRSRWCARSARLEHDGARGHAHPRHHRVRLRAVDGGAGRSGPASSAPENRHVAHAPSDVIASLDDLQAAVPEPRARRHRGGLVRHRSARRRMHAAARRRESRRRSTHRRDLVGRRPRPRDARIWSRPSTAGRPSAARRRTTASRI